jgi:peroxiredoxin
MAMTNSRLGKFLVQAAGIILFLGSQFSAISQQNHSATFMIRGFPGEKVYLYSYYGQQQFRIDSAFTDTKGYVEFLLHPGDAAGMYHMGTSIKDGLDFIFNGENISIRTSKEFWIDSVLVISSKENKIFYEYLVKKSYVENRLQLLKPLVQYYPESDPFYAEIVNHANQLAGSYSLFLDSLLKASRKMAVNGIIRFDQLERTRPGELSDSRRKYLRQHYFDNVDLSDTMIIHTPLLTAKLIDYLSLYLGPGMSRDQQEQSFIMAVDTLMSFTDSPEVREVIINYLTEGFQAYGFEKVLTHMVESYVINSSCVSEQEESKLKKRIEGFKKLAVGNSAPDFEAPDTDGKLVHLKTLQKDYKVLFFWASTCPHCDAIMADLEKVYDTYRAKIEIIGVSVDTSRTAWTQAVKTKNIPWINIAELQGWNGKIIQDYYVYATPTFIILDRNLTILSKPITLKELESELAELIK